MNFSIKNVICLSIFLSGICTLHCTRHTEAPNQNAEKQASELNAPKLNAPLFKFDRDQVDLFTILKDDPSAPLGEAHWSATAHLKEGVWSLASGPDSHPLLDALADRALIEHLLDTLKTLQATAQAPSGMLASLGLSPPFWALRWNAGQTSYELQIGAPVPRSEDSYAMLPGSKPFIATGATLKMLEYIKNFETLRLRNLFSTTSDEVGEFEFKRGKESIFYAQRENSDWVNLKHKPTVVPAGAILDLLTHAKILQFIDDPTLAHELIRYVDKHVLYEAVLKDRHENATRLKVSAKDGKFWVLVSNRPHTVFEIYPETVQLFTTGVKSR